MQKHTEYPKLNLIPQAIAHLQELLICVCLCSRTNAVCNKEL